MRTTQPVNSRNVPPAARTARKVRCSVTFCNEKYACSSDRARASYACEQCRTDQCDICEYRLHELTRYAHHDRRKLEPLSLECLCDSPTSVYCQPRNMADLLCEDCNWRRYCFDCDLKFHRGRPLSTHRRWPVDSVALLHAGSSDQNLNEQAAVSNQDTVTSPDNSDSLLFHSLPNANESNPSIIKEPETYTMNSNQASLLFLSIPSENDGTPTTYQLDKNESAYYQSTNSGNLLDNQADCSVAVMTLDGNKTVDNLASCSNDEVTNVTASLQGSVISPQYDDTGMKSFLLANHKEELLFSDESSFIQQLQCDPDTPLKVVSVFGKTGEGKSYTLNHTFFDGCEVFQTQLQDLSSIGTCTSGVWAAYDPVHTAIILDTEGWLGISSTGIDTLHMRHLFKVFAVSDVVIIQTKSDHLHSDLFHFLANASSVYQRYVSNDTYPAEFLPTSVPAVVLYHETYHADVLAKGAAGPAEKILRSRFAELGLHCNAVDTLQYVGIKTANDHPPDFKSLLYTVKKLLVTKQLRQPRKPAAIFSAMKKLYDKFSGSVDMNVSLSPEDQFCLSCKARCLSCRAHCNLSMNHEQNCHTEHSTDRVCEYQKQFDNRIYLCQACYRRGHEVVVIPKASALEDSSWMSLASYAWSGYVLECMNCGIIYRSRQHWFGNVDPEKSNVLKTVVSHVWPGSKPPLQVNVGRQLIDSLNYVSDVVTSASAVPAKAASQWVTDKLAPSYWIPNAQLTSCLACSKPFSTEVAIHHCRACGQGFCDKCTLKRLPVPERGWGSDLVRVCDKCYTLSCERQTGDDLNNSETTDEIVPRKVSEVIGTTVGTLASVVSYPFAMLREAARPDYWTPDEDITDCCVCNEPFNTERRVHHCRACGRGVCDKCSSTKRNVPSRGWHYPVRVCITCDAKNAV